MVNIMSKVKFKCDHCKIPTQRKPDRIVVKKGKRYCSDNCSDKDTKD